MRIKLEVYFITQLRASKLWDQTIVQILRTFSVTSKEIIQLKVPIVLASILQGRSSIIKISLDMFHILHYYVLVFALIGYKS